MDGSNNQSLQEVVVDQPLQQVIQQAITPQTVQAVVQAPTIQHPQPVILNHQLSDSRSTPRLPVQTLRTNPLSQLRLQHRQPQPRQILNQSQISPQNLSQQQRPRLAMPQPKPQNQAVALPDGTIVSVASYKKLLAEQKNKQGQQATTQSGVQTQQQQIDEPVVPKQFNAQHQRNLMHQQQQQRNQPRPATAPRMNQANYIILPPSPNRPQQQRPLPDYIPSSQIQQIIDTTPISKEYSDSIRMLVLLANGEQRLITFTLPKEACTIQEILEQVNVPFQHDTRIQVSEVNSNGINYIVCVGDVSHFPTQDEQADTEDSQQVVPHNPQATDHQPVVEQPKPPMPEPVKEVPKYIPGKLALCKMCGYLSEDFNKCTRCNRKLPEDVKAIPNKLMNGRVSETKTPEKKLPVKVSANNAGVPGQGPQKQLGSNKKKPAKPKTIDHETVCLVSSDEENDTKSPLKTVGEHVLSKLGSSISISPISKEPSVKDIQKHVLNKFNASPSDSSCFYSMNLECRTVRIGSYRFVPNDKVLIESTGITIQTPHPGTGENKTIKIPQSDIVRVLVNFNKGMPVVFYYLTPSVGSAVREVLNMDKVTERYFDPLSDKDESHKRITLLPEEFTEEEKTILQKIYSTPVSIIDELSPREANEILVKTCPKDLNKSQMNLSALTEVKQLFEYPPEGKGRLTINTEDYICLASDQFLNDVIIDFYLKYLVNNLPNKQQEKVHVFSTFFYKRLTTKPMRASRKCQPAELDNNLTAAQKRHARVKNWTKNVNLFEKDFVIVPINENAHWFLAIICFPGMDGCHTFDGQPYKLEPKTPRKKKGTTVKEKPPTIVCEDPEASDKDEAEGDDSDMDSDDAESDTSTPPSQNVTSPTVTVAPNVTPTKPKIERPPIKQGKIERPPIMQPCILIFDSLAGSSRSRVVATLRDYLTWEYKAKMNKERIFNKDIIKGSNVKVPQQNNFTDCGLYVLQYVEQFFKDPIVDYNIPIKQLKDWFEEIVVTRKREEISELIKNLMVEYDRDIDLLPKIKFPTINGKVIERLPEDEIENEEDMFEDSSFEEEEMDSGENPNPDTTTQEANIPVVVRTLKPDKQGENFNASVISAVNQDINEFPRPTSDKSTLNYLKAKRISRHKVEGPDPKKTKNE
ncbi:uncharacterized protein LOC109596804 isoform X3 [Aethina tumida]|nr:uncharacterized protein LOC109596804 isoform X3 [Aethina tumida]